MINIKTAKELRELLRDRLETLNLIISKEDSTDSEIVLGELVERVTNLNYDIENFDCSEVNEGVSRCEGCDELYHKSEISGCACKSCARFTIDDLEESYQAYMNRRAC